MQGEFRDPLYERISSLSALFARVPILLKYYANNYRQVLAILLAIGIHHFQLITFFHHLRECRQLFVDTLKWLIRR